MNSLLNDENMKPYVISLADIYDVNLKDENHIMKSKLEYGKALMEALFGCCNYFLDKKPSKIR